jgi:hypothetical protein
MGWRAVDRQLPSIRVDDHDVKRAIQDQVLVADIPVVATPTWMVDS